MSSRRRSSVIVSTATNRIQQCAGSALLSDDSAVVRGGIPTHILVNTSGIDFPAGLDQIELIDLRGMTLEKFPLIPDSYNPTLYTVEAFEPPEKFFYVKVTGVDELGYTIQRISHTAISAIKPRKPLVSIAERTRGIHDQTTVLTCQVESLVPYRVQWWHKDKQQGDSLSFSDSANATLEILRSSANDEGYYSCNVTNSAGYNDATTYLDVSEPPPLIIPPTNVSVLPGETAVLKCDVFNMNNLPYNVTWLREDNAFWSPFQDPRVSVRDDFSLEIR
ncbi:hemicentin-1 [Elysia marginata]|uniref:Hemicentin-1 n=1 Tax=Elysia marginata TaxID=1093978 RepID=A0AAV4F6U0_9GAST|nr:hemicentin-1 [Elysia marginata]